MNADLTSAFAMMWQGMLGLFIVMGLISLIVLCMTKRKKNE